MKNVQRLATSFCTKYLICILSMLYANLLLASNIEDTVFKTNMITAKEVEKDYQQTFSASSDESQVTTAPAVLNPSDLSLQNLILLALNYHPSIKYFQLHTHAAVAAQQSAKWQYFPSVSLKAQKGFANAHSSSFQGGNHQITVSITQPLWTGGELSSGLNIAKGNTVAARAQLLLGHRDIALKVIQSYGQWQATALKKNAWLKSLKTHKNLLALVNRRVNLGLSAKSDRALASGRLASNQAELVAITAQEEIAITNLSILTRHPLDMQSVGSSMAKSLKVSSSIGELLLMAQKISPEVDYAQAKSNVASAHIKQRRSAYQPKLSLRLEHQIGDFDDQNFGSESRIYMDLKSNFGAGLSMLSNVREAKALQQAANAQVHIEKLAIEEQVLTDYTLVHSNNRRIKALETSHKNAIRVANSYKRQFLAGQKSWLDVLNSTRDLVNQRLLLADAKAADLVASWRLATVTKGVDSYLDSSI